MTVIWLEMILWLLTGSYALFTLWLWRIWKRIPVYKPGSVQPAGEGKLLTVVIPVRNEEECLPALLRDLAAQSLDYGKFEVIVVDDSSTDNTPRLVQEFINQSPLDLHLLTSDGDRSASPKKRAISTAIQHSKGKYIVTTDGDCRVGVDWLRTIALFFERTDAKCVSGPVTFLQEEKIGDYLQTVEFSSLVGSGACAIAAGFPNMCNGANFAYEKSVFLEVGGFDGVDQIASGDDEFLLHKIAARYPDSVAFLKAEEAVVQTAPHRSWQAFKNQRQRWASKWKYYRNLSPKVLAVFIFLANVSLLVAVAGFASGLSNGYAFLSIAGLKLLPEWLFIGAVLRFLGKAHTVAYIPLVQVLYPGYVLYFGLAGQKRSYRWKGRELR